MRSWLSNPVVAFIGFLASLITVAEYVVFIARRVTKRGHSYIWAALISLAVAVAVSPLEWSAIMAQATKIHDGGVWAVLYVLMVDGLALASAGVLLVGAIEDHKFPVFAWSTLVGCLAFGASMYIHNHGMLGWGSYAAIAAPGVVTLMLLLITLGRLMPHPRT